MIFGQQKVRNFGKTVGSSPGQLISYHCRMSWELLFCQTWEGTLSKKYPRNCGSEMWQPLDTIQSLDQLPTFEVWVACCRCYVSGPNIPLRLSIWPTIGSILSGTTPGACCGNAAPLDQQGLGMRSELDLLSFYFILSKKKGVFWRVSDASTLLRWSRWVIILQPPLPWPPVKDDRDRKSVV